MQEHKNKCPLTTAGSEVSSDFVKKLTLLTSSVHCEYLKSSYLKMCRISLYCAIWEKLSRKLSFNSANKLNAWLQSAWSLGDRSHLTTTMWIFCVVRNGLHDYQCYWSHLTTKIKWSIVIIVNGTHFYRLEGCRQVRTDPYLKRSQYPSEFLDVHTSALESNDASMS